MSSGSKGDSKAALDAAAWMFNVVTSVGIILVNKALMATYGFTFGNMHIFCWQVPLFIQCIFLGHFPNSNILFPQGMGN